MRDDELAGNVQDPNGLYPDAENNAMFQYKRRLRDQPGYVENLYSRMLAARREPGGDRLEVYNHADDDDMSVAVRALLASPPLRTASTAPAQPAPACANQRAWAAGAAGAATCRRS